MATHERVSFWFATVIFDSNNPAKLSEGFRVYGALRRKPSEWTWGKTTYRACGTGKTVPGKR